MSLRRRFRIACLTLLVLFLLVAWIDRSVDVPFIPSARASTSEWLDCNAFDSTWTQWTTSGSSPYLGAQDQPTNMIEEKKDLDQMGWFDFPSTSITSGTIKANISIYCRNMDGAGEDWADVYVDYTGSGSGADVGDVGQHTGWQYDVIDLGTHTVGEINNLRVYFVFRKVGGAKEVYIDHARIGIRPAIDTVDADGPYNVGQTISVTWTNYDGFPSGEDYINVEYYDQTLGQQLAVHSLATTATSDTYGPIGGAQAGSTIEVWVYTASGQTDDHTLAITQGRPWPETCYVNPGVPEFSVGIAPLLLVAPAAYVMVRRRSASHNES